MKKQASIHNLFKRKLDSVHSSGEGSNNAIPQPTQPQSQPTSTTHTSSGSIPTNIDLNELPSDPADRPSITSYHPNVRDEIRRAYWIRKACKPKGHKFPSTQMGKKQRRFVVDWFNEFDWLEYNIKEDKAYCLCCYLFRDYGGRQGGREAFVTEGFSNWSKKERLYIHVGDVGSFHNKAREKCELLVKQNQSINASLHKQSAIEKSKYEGE
ncbi:hypothetical protein L1887_31349 [Cichorium endivia]|nr:hypothetical protein L1887_31349 [Cichorium endivia]